MGGDRVFSHWFLEVRMGHDFGFSAFICSYGGHGPRAVSFFLVRLCFDERPECTKENQRDPSASANAYGTYHVCSISSKNVSKGSYPRQSVSSKNVSISNIEGDAS